MRPGEQVLRNVVSDPTLWHQLVYPTASYPWQIDVCKGIEKLVHLSRTKQCQPGLEAVVVVSRQGGKNELSARSQARLLCRYSSESLCIVRAAPTAKPQLHISKLRLRGMFKTPLLQGLDRWEEGYICYVNNAHICFLSAEANANRVGHTASLSLEVDEAQDVDPEIYAKDFRPMLATTGAPTFLFGTVWSDDTLLEQKRKQARENERKYGVKLLWEVDADEVGRYNPTYRDYVAYEVETYGRNHPIIKTQYYLEAVTELDKFLDKQQLAQLRGHHPRQFQPRSGAVYVAGIDLCGAIEQDLKDVLKNEGGTRKRDSTVVTIGELMWKRSSVDPTKKLPIVRIVDHLYLPAQHPMETVNRIYSFVFEHWRCVSAVVDASGVGDYPAMMLQSRRPSQCKAIKSTVAEVSRLGYNYIGAVGTDRLTMYRDPDESEQYRQFWIQHENCKREMKQNNNMRFYAPLTRQPTDLHPLGEEIHDDFVKSGAYCLEAAELHMSTLQHDMVSQSTNDEWEWNGGGY